MLTFFDTFNFCFTGEKMTQFLRCFPHSTLLCGENVWMNGSSDIRLSESIYAARQCNCHESGCHSLQLHITHGLHRPSCTAHTHSRPPLHQSHSCHHSLINPDCLTTPAPHSLTHIKAAHKHSPSAKSCFPWLTFPSVFPLCVYLFTTWTVDSLSWSFAACLTDPACLLIILSVCCLPWPIALPLFTNLSSLRCPRYHCLIFACLTTSLFQ